MVGRVKGRRRGSHDLEMTFLLPGIESFVEQLHGKTSDTVPFNRINASAVGGQADISRNYSNAPAKPRRPMLVARGRIPRPRWRMTEG
jgi:hypothetical protein